MRDPYITEVVLGTVTATHAIVSGDALQVDTVSDVRVTRARHLRSGTTITVREVGGIVPLQLVRGDFEGKGQTPLTEDDLQRPVDYTYLGSDHPQVGDQALFALTESRDGAYGSVLRLRSDGTRLRWPAPEAPNPRWPSTFPVSILDLLLQDS